MARAYEEGNGNGSEAFRRAVSAALETIREKNLPLAARCALETMKAVSKIYEEIFETLTKEETSTS